MTSLDARVELNLLFLIKILTFKRIFISMSRMVNNKPLASSNHPPFLTFVVVVEERIASFRGSILEHVDRDPVLKMKKKTHTHTHTSITKIILALTRHSKNERKKWKSMLFAWMIDSGLISTPCLPKTCHWCVLTAQHFLWTSHNS